mmetsp:Transcript_52454/g.67270  ORF Transcript_52454/g.67270 Transcript_52454/m.67270 type:complete len:207 (-) Transcript_52454:117-737(-)
MAESNPFEDPCIDEASKARPDKAKNQKKSNHNILDEESASDAPGWVPKPVESQDGTLPEDWVQMRLANVIGVSLMIITGLFNFLGGSSISTAILALYAMSFGCMLCCFELRLKMFVSAIAKNFGFMYKPKGRIAFLMLCSFLMLSLGSIMSYIVGAYIFALVPANVYMLLKYPGLEKEAIDYQTNGIRATIMARNFKASQEESVVI